MPYSCRISACGVVTSQGVATKTVNTQGGEATVAEFSLCVGRPIGKGKQRQRDDYFFLRVSCWHEQARAVAETLGPRSHVVVTGDLDIRTWKDQSGAERQSIDLRAEHVAMLCFKERMYAPGPAPQEGGHPQPPTKDGSQRQAASGANWQAPEIPNDDIPF